MNMFLKVIGSGRNACPEHYAEPYVDFSPSRPPDRVHIGDHLILYAAGGSKRVFAIAKVVSEAYPSGLAEWPHRLDIRYVVRVWPADGVPAHEVSTIRDLTMSVRQQTCIALRKEEYDRAASRLAEVAAH